MCGAATVRRRAIVDSTAATRYARRPTRRARDLVSRMTLEEKAGAMMHGTARSGGPMGAIGVGSG